ncbi:glycosyltransferase [Haladaptatus sp. DJG-WS-42]|uniref:glycosyltransferase n=2 Tax=Haladaptatus sp. DJG-WS-42 TaxID=3120516 RepID=UPI0030D4B88E
MMPRVAAFTDTYLPTVNGVTYTVKTWRERWLARGGRMDIVFPKARGYSPDQGEHAVRSLPFPFYDGFYLGTPSVPSAVSDVDIVHAHTPFSLGLGGLRLSREVDAPFITSYHTPTSEYADYLAQREFLSNGLGRIAESYERWFFGHADTVLVPSEDTKRHLTDEVGIESRVEVVPNGVDIETFRPTDGAEFRHKHGIDPDQPLVGYTGRHGFEKSLTSILDAVAGLDVTVVFGGDGPARETLEARAEDMDMDIRFLGFLDREDLPSFYAALDVFAFPSPVETQGIVALEANAAGTPVVGVNAGALEDTVIDGVTGYHFEPGDIAGFSAGIEQALENNAELSENCVNRRDQISVEAAVDQLLDVYERELAQYS